MLSHVPACFTCKVACTQIVRFIYMKYREEYEIYERQIKKGAGIIPDAF